MIYSHERRAGLGIILGRRTGSAPSKAEDSVEYGLEGKERSGEKGPG
jgi:hypothetical protein